MCSYLAVSVQGNGGAVNAGFTGADAYDTSRTIIIQPDGTTVIHQAPPQNTYTSLTAVHGQPTPAARNAVAPSSEQPQAILCGRCKKDIDDLSKCWAHTFTSHACIHTLMYTLK